jgi:hypothetical protein
MTVYADDRVDTRHALLSTLIAAPTPGTVISPWSLPIDNTVPEEYFTSNPTSFPDDILAYFSTSHEEARAAYVIDVEVHVTKEMRETCPIVMELLTSSLTFDVFVPDAWLSIDMPPYHLETKPGFESPHSSC